MKQFTLAARVLLMVCATLVWLTLPTSVGAQEISAEAKKDLKTMQGNWELEALEVNGALVPVEKLAGTKLTIKDNQYLVFVKNKQVGVVTMKLDPSQNPKELDMAFQDGAKKDQVLKGIYNLKDGKLQMARGIDANQDRPRQFATWPDTNYFVVTWRRAAK